MLEIIKKLPLQLMLFKKTLVKIKKTLVKVKMTPKSIYLYKSQETFQMLK